MFPRSCLLFLVCALTSCTPTLYMKAGSTLADFDAQKARCDYETAVATQQTDYGYRTVLGQELDRALRKNDLMHKCFAAYGWTPASRASVAESAALPPQTAPSFPPPQLLPMARPAPSVGIPPDERSSASSPPLLPFPTLLHPSTGQLQAHYTTERLLLKPHADAERLTVVGSRGPLRLLAQQDDWFYVETPDGRRGWIARQWLLE